MTTPSEPTNSSSVPHPLDTVWAMFIEERKYNMNVTSATLSSYEYVWRTCKPAFPQTLEELTPETAKGIVKYLRMTPATGHGLHERTAGGTNVSIRTLNAFFTWLHESKRTPALIALQLLKTEKKVLPTYGQQYLEGLMAYKPVTLNETRIRAMFVLIVDTGCRMTEVRLLERSCVDMDHMQIKVYGKGRKERIVPFGVETRKILYNWMKQHTHEIVFATRTGAPISPRNAQRDLNVLWDKMKLPRVAFAFHSGRRTFATTYWRNGGDLFRLQATLGHCDLSTTKRYVAVTPEDLQRSHAALSPFATIRR